MYIGKQDKSQISLAATTISLCMGMGKKVRGEADTFNNKHVCYVF